MAETIELRTLSTTIIRRHKPVVINLALLRYFTQRLLGDYSRSTQTSLDHLIDLQGTVITDAAEAQGIDAKQLESAYGAIFRAGEVVAYINSYSPHLSDPGEPEPYPGIDRRSKSAISANLGPFSAFLAIVCPFCRPAIAFWLNTNMARHAAHITPALLAAISTY